MIFFLLQFNSTYNKFFVTFDYLLIFFLDETPDLSQPEWEDIHLITGKKIIFALHL